VRGDHFLLLAFVPAVIIGLTFFLNRTPFGLSVRAAADEADVARLAGISVKRVSTLVWGIAGALAATTYAAVAPMRGVLVGAGAATTLALGPGLLMRALAAALVGRLKSLPMTIVGGVAIGIGEALLFNNIEDPGIVSFGLFLVVVALVVWRNRDRVQGVVQGDGNFSLTPKVSPIPQRVLGVWWVRRLPLMAGAFALLLAIAIPFVATTPSRQYLFAEMLLLAVIGVSVVVLTGWAGQLSLGQFAFCGVGAVITAGMYHRGVPIVVTMPLAMAVGALLALAVGIPALRFKGLFLAILTLAVALAGPEFLLHQSILTDGQPFPLIMLRGQVGPFDLSDQRTFYFLCLAVLTVVLVTVGHLRTTGIGRSIIAVRDNEASASAYGISPTVAKLRAFALSGAIASMGGVMLATLYVQFNSDRFLVEHSLRIVSMAIIGGLGSIFGAVLGALYIAGLPAAMGASGQVALLTSGLGLLILLMYLPGGLAQVLFKLRDLVVAQADKQLTRQAAARATAEDLDGDDARPTPARKPAAVPTVSVTRKERPHVPHSVPALVATDVRVSFGGLLALDGVSISATQHETVGLIGSNGAGKSTLMNIITGFIAPTAGRIEVFGEDVTLLSPHRRAGAGLARVFQDARLFGSLTVRDSILVALEASDPARFVPSLLGLPSSRRSERAKRSQADELIAFLGLGRYADEFIGVLSTGTRRICELACIMAANPRVMLLDEPTAGIAQRETEAFGPLIDRVKNELGATMILIEHDMPLVMSLSDRIYCMSAGRVIAEGAPEQMRTDPAVIAAYLGTDDRAIDRSDTNRAVAAAGSTQRKGEG
jgi:ABC-type branched-subunit amino acid transport system ATPase component/ABC-type branched-subunit amino acid transport system permease subunit